MKVQLTIISLLCIIGTSLGQSKLGFDLKEAFAEGQTYYEDGKLDSAQDAFFSILRHDSRFAPAFYYVGLILQDNNMNDSAEAYYKLAVRADSNCTDPYSNLLVIVEKNIDVEKGAQLALKSVLRDSTSVSAQLNYAFALYRLGHLDEATPQFRRVARMAPGELGKLASLESSQDNNWSIAIYLYKIELDLLPSDPATLYNLGTAELMNHHFVDAETHLQRAWHVCDSTSPLYESIFNANFEILLALGKYKEILEDTYTKMPEDTSLPHYYRALAEYALGDTVDFRQEAKAYFSLKGEPVPSSLISWAKEKLEPFKAINAPKE